MTIVAQLFVQNSGEQSGRPATKLFLGEKQTYFAFVDNAKALQLAQ